MPKVQRQLDNQTVQKHLRLKVTLKLTQEKRLRRLMRPFGIDNQYRLVERESQGRREREEPSTVLLGVALPTGVVLSTKNLCR